MQVTRRWEKKPSDFLKKFFYKRKRLVRLGGEIPNSQLYKLDKQQSGRWQGISGFSGVSSYSGYSGNGNGSGYSGYGSNGGLQGYSGWSGLSGYTMTPKAPSPAATLPAPQQTFPTRNWHIEFRKVDSLWRIKETFNWDCYGLRDLDGKDYWSKLSEELRLLEFKHLRDIKDWIFIESL